MSAAEGKAEGKVFLLLFAGQSNALGWGYKQYLLETNNPLAEPQEDVELYYSIAGEGYLPENQLIPLQPGTSHKLPKPGGHYPDLPEPVCRFGPELSMARTVKDRLADPDAKVAVVKFAHGGTSLYDRDDWRPDGTADSRGDGKLYQIFQATVRGAVKALEAKYPGREVVIMGMGWVQGPSDALEGKADEYEENLTRLVEDVRATYGEQVVFALSQVSPNQYAYSQNRSWVEQWEKVAAAQEAVAKALPDVAMISTAGDKYPVSATTSEGLFHFSTPGLLQIGQDLGNAIAEMSGQPLVDEALIEEDYTLRVTVPAEARQVRPGQSAPMASDGHVVLRVGGAEGDLFTKGSRVFTNRDFVLNGPLPQLEGLPFIRANIDRISFSVVAGGKLYALTPLRSSTSISQVSALEEAGFKPVAVEADQPLFGTNRGDRILVYEKVVKPGESYAFGKWTVLVGAMPEGQEVSVQKALLGSEEMLYNGIVLPATWPPTHYVASREVMPVPYLEQVPEVIPIDVGRQLFVDDFLIEQTDLSRTYHHPVKYEGNPVLKPETPFEIDPGNGLATAAPKSGGLWWDSEEQIFKMWYEAGWFGAIALATSRDGLHWERPQVEGAAQNRTPNEVTPAGLKPDSWNMIIDTWSGNPDERYKLFVRRPGGSWEINGLCYVSPDGVNWSEPSVSGPMGDRSSVFYNPFRQKWVFSIRSMYTGRSRHYWESDDFMTGNFWTWDETDFWKGRGWTPGEPVVWTAADKLDPEDPVLNYAPQLYNLDAVPYESLMLGLFQIWLGPHNNETNGVPKITELEFAYSRDGFHWDRPDRTPAIATARTPGAWDRGYLQSVGGVCVVVGDELWFYYGGSAGDESRPKDGLYANASTGLAVMRRDGFASMDASGEPGTLTTRPVVFSGSRLFVNADVAEGALRAEIRDADGNAIAPFTLDNCEPVTADSTLEEVRWSGAEDLSALAGSPVRIHFEVDGGALYAFWVSPDESGRSDGYVAAGGPGFTGPTDTVGRQQLKAAEVFVSAEADYSPGDNR
ncbi:hypothetical protein H5P28_06430 [Ruficoccus amylovorans]|uniref:Sialate O-acetylesterase domain-containing protein n=1 Tax=Ruficoccus amylovorans TaxID=1804625 RepID=A0A842HED9_9BACT|nr:hypothetical protein [Ruficoccus amylovorans]